DVSRRIEMKIPDVLKQHGARYDAALVADQIFEQLKFAGKQIDFPAAPAGGAVDQVDLEIADPQDGLLGDDVAAPAKRLEARQQLDEGERLDQIVVAPGAQAAHSLIDLAERADDQERRSDALLAQPRLQMHVMAATGTPASHTEIAGGVHQTRLRFLSLRVTLPENRPPLCASAALRSGVMRC